MKCDNIKIIIPFKPQYVSVARLAISGICSRVGFDVETIEDIKVAVAEVCNRLIEIGSKNQEAFEIIFSVYEKSIKIDFLSNEKEHRELFDSSQNELGFSIISALMDEVQTGKADSIISMSKSLEG